MQAHLSEDLQVFIRSEVALGRFTSEEEVIAEAIRRLKRDEEASKPNTPGPTTTHEVDDRPIWEFIQELTADVPDEEFLKLPTDGAEHFDHYIYGHAKRSNL